MLAGATGVVRGSGATADILRQHLTALGAAIAPAPAAPGLAAAAELVLRDGRRREVVVSWSGPVHEPALTDEATVQAVCGVMHVHGRRDGHPVGLTVDYCSTAAGILAMSGLLATLLCARPEGTVRTSVAEAALLTVSQYLAAAGADDPEAVALAPGGPPFTSADGVRFEVEALHPEPWSAFWTDLAAPTAAVTAGWRPFQFRYATATAPLPVDLHHTTRAHTFARIVSAAEYPGVSVCRLYSAAEHAAELPARPFPLWQAEIGDRPAARPSSLENMTVLEAGRRVQAPLAAHLLRLLGARVVRIEPPGGDPLRGMPPSCGDLSARWLALNRGKHAVELDIKHPADRARIRHLAETAEVFLHNWAPGRAEQLGLDATGLPGHLVYAHTSGWGGHQLPGTPPGTDFMVQARTGLADLVRPADRAPARSLLTILDVLGGLLGAEAVLAGLLTRARAGRGVGVESSLLAAATQLRPTGRRPAGFRQPRDDGGGWTVAPDDPAAGPPVPVTTNLADLLTDPRCADVIGRDDHGAPALTRPWTFT